MPTGALIGAKALPDRPAASSLGRIAAFWQNIGQAHRAEPEVYKLLVASLFSSPASIIPGGIAGILTPFLCWYATGLAEFMALTIATIVIVLMRFVTLFGYLRQDRTRHTYEDTRRWDREFFIGATVFSFSLGINAWLALTITDNVAAHLTAVSCTIAFSSGFVARNAGRPAFVIIQLMTFCIPLAVGLLSAANPLYEPIGYFAFLFFFNNVAITLSVHRNLLALSRTTKKAQELSAELSRQNITLDAALNHMSHGLAMFDASLNLAVSNRRFRELFHLPAELTQPGTPIGVMEAYLTDVAVVGAEDMNEVALACQRVLRIGQEAQVEFVTSRGRALVLSIGSVPDGGIIIHTEDATERKQTEAKVERMARYDELTGLANRFEFGAVLKKACGRLSRAHHSLSVLYVDLDNFKQINDSLGHDTGDQVLIETARRLQAAVGPTDVVARFGGDEFVIINFGLTEADGAATGQRIVEAMAQPIEIRGKTLHLTASVGVAFAPAHGTRPADLLRHADLALYGAKQGGRRTCTVFSPEMAAAASERTELENHLRRASQMSTLSLHYQPIVDLATGRIEAFEALMRWPHPQRGQIAPGVFIPIAEEIGLIGPLGDWAIRQACMDAAGWPSAVGVAVNVSPLQFRNPEKLIRTVREAIALSGIAPGRLSLEVTETLLIEDQETTLRAIHELKEIGIKLSLDDFGTGYSSLAYLATYPFSQVKIDRSFAQDVTSNAASRFIIQAVCELAHRFNMRVLVEGIETEEQVAAVRSLGAEAAQGFLFGRAEPLEAIMPRVRDAA